MSQLAKLTVAALIVPLAVAPTAHASLRLEEPVVVVAPTAAPAPVVVAPTAAPATVVVAPTAVATPSAVVPVAPPQSWNDVAAQGTVTVNTTTTTTTTTTTIPAVVTTSPAPANVVSPREAVRNLLRYDPYLAPRYRSGRNMVIGGAVSMGIGAAALFTTLSWARYSRAEVEGAWDASDHRRLAADRNRHIPLARVVGVASAILLVGGIILVAAGAIKKRRAVEEARGRVFMQAGPGGMTVRF